MKHALSFKIVAECPISKARDLQIEFTACSCRHQGSHASWKSAGMQTLLEKCLKMNPPGKVLENEPSWEKLLKF
jgi:hypothetical protein